MSRADVRRPAREWAVVCALAVVAAAATFAGSELWNALSVDDVGMWPWVAMCAVTLSCIAPVVILKRRGRRLDLFHPLVVFAAMWFFAYVVPGFSLLSGHDTVWGVFQDAAYGHRESLVARSLFLSALAAIFVQLGFFAPRPRIRDSVAAPPLLDEERFRVARRFLTVLAIAGAMALMLKIGGFRALISGLNDRVRLFAGLNYLGMPALSLLGVSLLWYEQQLRSGKKTTPSFWVFVAFASGLNVIGGSRTNLLGFIVAMLVLRHYLRKNVSVAGAVIAAVLLVSTGLFYELYFREYLVAKAITSIDLSQNFSVLAPILWDRFSSGAFLQLQTMMLIVGGIPSRMPWLNGRHYLALALMPIPRALFPGKPPVGTQIFSQYFFPDQLAAGTSFPTSMLGEFYMNFGILGVCIGALLAGWLLRKSYARAVEQDTAVGRLSLHALVIGTLFPWIRGDSFGPTVFFAGVAVPLLLTMYYAGRAVRKPQ